MLLPKYIRLVVEREYLVDSLSKYIAILREDEGAESRYMNEWAELSSNVIAVDEILLKVVS